MKRILIASYIIAILLALVGCNASERINDKIYLNGIDDISVEYGIATITSGNTIVIVNHTLGVVPVNIQLTLLGTPDKDITFGVKNPTSLIFGIEASDTSASDMRIYWCARR